MRDRWRLPATVLLLVFGLACVGEPSARTSPAAGRPAALAEPEASPTPIASCRAHPRADLDPSVADARWEKRIEAIVRDHRVGVAVGRGGDLVYAHDARRTRLPASNQKLLLSFALFDRLGPHYRIPTAAAAAAVDDGTVGDLWVMGRGDPTLTAHEPGYWGGIEATTLARLAERIKRSGIREVNGRVMAAADYFAHDLDAPGWQPYVPHQYVQTLSSLVLRGNHVHRKPERAVAAALTKELKRIGVPVTGTPGSGKPPTTLSPIARVRSRPLAEIVAFMNHTSNNFFAEMLGKLLGADLFGPPGTIEKGARAIAAWTGAHGVEAIALDSSGLSYRNRVSPEALVELLGVAETTPWGVALRDGLPGPSEGTLRYRLPGLEVRAKTGTLFNGASALSGWVRSTWHGRWVAFSILDRNAPKTLEDRIVRIISRARVRAPSATSAKPAIPCPRGKPGNAGRRDACGMAIFVLHVDIDQFIAAVEVLRRPELRGRPVVVGGDGDPTKRGVVSTASYEARRFGIRSGMPLLTAACRCPEAVFLPVDRETYERASRQVMQTLDTFDGILEVAGWDEAFMEIGSDDPETVAEKIKRAVRSQTGLSCSVGIGDNKLRAKVASELAKPGGVFRLTKVNWFDVMGARPTDSLWGVGRKSARRLAELGIESVDDLARADEASLSTSFGPRTGPWLRQIAFGEHFGRVSADPYVPKSRGKEVTFQEDLSDREGIRAEIARLARAVASDIEREDRLASGITVKVRFAPFDTHARNVRLEAPTKDREGLVRAALQALDRFDIDRPVRLLGVRADLVPPPGLH